jgi:hypothetical protein
MNEFHLAFESYSKIDDAFSILLIADLSFLDSDKNLSRHFNPIWSVTTSYWMIVNRLIKAYGLDNTHL